MLVILGLSAAVLVLVPISKPGAFAVRASSGCTNANLSGSYGLAFSGFQRQHQGSVAFYGGGLAIADGGGNFAATFADSVNGVSSTNNAYTATYTVNADCTLSINATPGSGGDNFVGVIVNGGGEILATDISANDTLNLDLKRQ